MDFVFAPQTFNRTDESRAFEEFWRSLRGANLIPSRADFQPAKARRFLGDIVLMEAPSAQCPSLRIRVTGQRFDNLIGANLTGQDNLDFMPPEYRAGAIATARKMIEQPCGLWQISAAHLVFGYATNLEITAFPLSADKDGKSYLLTYVLSAGGLGPVSMPTDHGIGINTAATYRYLDIGAGEPSVADKAA
jgi:hypothetical protein